jgi:hypothetical protein
MMLAVRDRRRRQAPANTVLEEPRSTRETAPGRTRVAAARGAWAAGSAMLSVARLVRLAVALVVLVIAVAIVLRVVGANPANSVVSDIHDAGRALVGPFKNVFTIKNAKADLAVNWGVAAIVYLIVGGLLARLIARAAPRGLPPRNRVGAVA